MTPEPPKTKVSGKIVYQNPWITIHEDQTTTPEGHEGVYGYMETKDSVLVVALNEENKACMLRSFRYPTQTWGWEFSGGGGEGEAALEAAKRELEGNSYKCENEHVLYANSSPVVSVYFVSEDGTKVLLAVRGVEPDKGKLDAPGGFLDGAEDFEVAAKRELIEELSLQPDEYEPLRYLAAGTGTYAFDGETVSLTGVGYWTRLKTTRPLQASDDVAAVEWHDLHTMDMTLIAGEEIRGGIMTLRKLFPLNEKEQ